MARFYGEIGFLETKQTAPGVWGEVITKRNYYGDVLQSTIRWATGQSLNDDFVTSNRISVVSDKYLNSHLASIKYVVWEGVKWTVRSWEIRRPRLILTLGDVYNAPEDGIE